jgi:SAM-dependent methyltransferase
MATVSTTIKEWESAEIERSVVEAQLTSLDALRMDDVNIERYLDPPANTPYPLEFAFHLLGDIAGKHVLDYGCGNGENCVPLARRESQLIGLDVSEALLDLARLRMRLNGLGGQATFVAGSAHGVDLPDNSIDVVLGVAILHHLDLDIAASEIYRLLKPGGRAIFQEPVRNSALLKAVRAMIPYRQEDISPYERPLTDGEIRRFSALFTAGRNRVFSLPFVNLAQVAPALRKYVPQLYRIDRVILRRMRALHPFATIRVFELIKT